MLKVDARGDACPLPVVKAKKAIAELNGAGEVEVLVDNEIAGQKKRKLRPAPLTPAPIRWWSSRPTRWARVLRSWARPC